MDYTINDRVCIFLFNPFGCKSIKLFIEKNYLILREKKSFLLYANDHCINEVSNYAKILKRDNMYNISVSQFD